MLQAGFSRSQLQGEVKVVGVYQNLLSPPSISDRCKFDGLHHSAFSLAGAFLIMYEPRSLIISY